jgi:NAD(P)-dependent dehydrogenase (short-subunit alcohol dehydrogenase family)
MSATCRVLVTGGSGAIGAAIAERFAADGHAVAVGYGSSKERAQAVADRITAAGGTAYADRIDQSDPASVTAGVDAARHALGGIDVLVANAVSWPGPDDDDWGGLVSQLTVNVAGTAAVVDAVLPAMRQAGWGRVVLVSSDLVAQPMPGPITYPCVKAAIEGMATVLAVREARHGILVNVVRPGLTMTERLRNSSELGPAVDAETTATPTGRLCTPEDVAATVAHLGTAANQHVNGAVVSVAGGRELTR